MTERTETITVSTCRACGAEYRSSSAKALHRCKAGWKTRKETREVQERISYQPGYGPTEEARRTARGYGEAMWARAPRELGGES